MRSGLRDLPWRLRDLPWRRLRFLRHDDVRRGEHFVAVLLEGEQDGRPFRAELAVPLVNGCTVAMLPASVVTVVPSVPAGDVAGVSAAG